jgi:hypothetical protein
MSKLLNKNLSKHLFSGEALPLVFPIIGVVCFAGFTSAKKLSSAKEDKDLVMEFPKNILKDSTTNEFVAINEIDSSNYNNFNNSNKNIKPSSIYKNGRINFKY